MSPAPKGSSSTNYIFKSSPQFLLFIEIPFSSCRLTFDSEELRKEISFHDEEIQKCLMREKELKDRMEDVLNTRKQTVLQKVNKILFFMGVHVHIHTHTYIHTHIQIQTHTHTPTHSPPPHTHTCMLTMLLTLKSTTI